MIEIDEEFEALCPPLSKDEYSQLEANIIKEGCREPLILWGGLLIDGHNRYNICTAHNIAYETKTIDLESYDAALIWIIRNQFGRRNLSLYDRGRLALKLEPLLAEKAKENQILGGKEKGLENSLNPISTQHEIAKVAGISQNTVNRIKVIESSATPEEKSSLSSGKSSINEVYKSIKKRTEKEEKAVRKSAIPEDIPHISERYRLICSDLANAEIEENSIDCIITDPPYPQEYLHVYGTLAEQAAKWLKPGGSLIVMCGQSWFPEVLMQMSGHLTYNWMLAYLTPGGQATQIFPRKVNTFWKPLLWFVKDKYAGDWIGDVTKSEINDNDKRFHAWGQSESGMSDIIERFTNPGDTILDPFLGGGTTGVVAINMNRLFVGIDVDQKCVDQSALRMQEADSVLT